MTFLALMCSFMEMVYRPWVNRLRIHQVMGSLKLIGLAKTSNLFLITFFHVKCLFLSSLRPSRTPTRKRVVERRNDQTTLRHIFGGKSVWQRFIQGWMTRSVEEGHTSQRIKGTEGKSESHEKKQHAPESPLPRIRHTEVAGLRKLNHGLPQHPLTYVDGNSGTL